MTRTEHREANHLEDDGGIREIIQSARIMPISDNERSSHGQMAPLDVPQQLWGRPGWSQFHGPIKNTTNESTASKRKLEDAAVDAEDEEKQPRKKTVRRTLAFVDCTNSEPRDLDDYKYVEVDDSDEDDEPLIDRYRATSPTTASSLAVQSPLKMRSENPDGPLMPSMGYLNELGVGADALPKQPFGSSSYATPGHDTIDQAYRRLPIAQLLNEDLTAAEGHQLEDQGLLREILRRL